MKQFNTIKFPHWGNIYPKTYQTVINFYRHYYDLSWKSRNMDLTCWVSNLFVLSSSDLIGVTLLIPIQLSCLHTGQKVLSNKTSYSVCLPGEYLIKKMYNWFFFTYSCLKTWRKIIFLSLFLSLRLSNNSKIEVARNFIFTKRKSN